MHLPIKQPDFSAHSLHLTVSNVAKLQEYSQRFDVLIQSSISQKHNPQSSDTRINSGISLSIHSNSQGPKMREFVFLLDVLHWFIHSIIFFLGSLLILLIPNVATSVALHFTLGLSLIKIFLITRYYYLAA